MSRSSYNLLPRRTCPLSSGEFNRSTQHLLILLGWEVIDGCACTDVVYAEAMSRTLGAVEERSMRGGYRPRT
jgi:hypothetical protein